MQVEQAWAMIPLGAMFAAISTTYGQSWISKQVILKCSMIACIAATVTRAYSSDIQAYFIASFVYGLGTGALLVLLTDIVSNCFSSIKLATAQAVFFGSYALGTAIAFGSSNDLAQVLGDWRIIPVLWAGVSVVCAYLLLRVENMALPTHLYDNTESVASIIKYSPVIRFAVVYGAYVGAYLGIVGLLPIQLRIWGFSSQQVDFALVCSVFLFLIGALLWGHITDRSGHREKVFFACMVCSALCTVVIATTASNGYTLIPLVGIACIGFFGGSMCLFFPMLLEHPKIGVKRNSISIGITTSASYFGGFLVPIIVSTFVERAPVLGLYMFAISYLVAGIFLPNLWAFQKTDAKTILLKN